MKDKWKSWLSVSIGLLLFYASLWMSSHESAFTGARTFWQGLGFAGVALLWGSVALTLWLISGKKGQRLTDPGVAFLFFGFAAMAAFFIVYLT